jgi:cytochrome c oxidase cbb3-type subunit 1
MSSTTQPVEAWMIRQMQCSVVRHSLGWLLAANLVGVWLALLLVHPEWGQVTGEFTYGRWMPLHLNWQLYGWCSIPSVGLLLRRFLPPTERALMQAQWALRGWSIALAVGGWSWLHGQTSGKLFLDWAGIARVVFLVAQAVLWFVLAGNYLFAREPRSTRSRLAVAMDSIILAALASVPAILYWTTGRNVYPPVDPSTGGPTGASLLGSTLVIVLVIGLLPKAFSLRATSPRKERLFWGSFCVSALVFGVSHDAPAYHTDWRQIGAMGSLLLWLPLVPAYLRQFAWAKGTRPWLAAAMVLWGILLLTGFLMFLPGLLDVSKFTHVLVAHAHLAMAGLLTCVNFLILGNLAPDAPLVAKVLGNRFAFVAWQAALLLHLAALLQLAAVELKDPAGFYYGAHSGVFQVRLLAGIAMAAASTYWVIQWWVIHRPQEKFHPIAACGNPSYSA